MPNIHYDPRFDLIALDKVRRGCSVGTFPNNNFTRKYFDDFWMWKRKYETLMRLRKEYLPGEQSRVFK